MIYFSSAAKVEPVIADPFVDGGIEIDSTCAFMVIMSDGLYQALTDATGTETVNGDIAKMVAQEFGQQTTLTGVAQAVVDRVVRIHHDTFMTESGDKKDLCQKRDDITLLVRNFHFPLSVQQRNMQSPSHPPHHLSGFPANVYKSPSLDTSRQSSSTDSPITPTNYLLSGPNLLGNTTEVQTNGSSNYSTSSSGEMQLFSQRHSENSNLELDAEGKVSTFIYQI